VALFRPYRLRVFGDVRSKRGTFRDGEVLALPVGLPDVVLAGSNGAPVFELKHEPGASGRPPSAEEWALITPHVPADAAPVVPVIEAGQIARRKASSLEALRAAPPAQDALFPGAAYDYQTPLAWAVANLLGRLHALPDAVAAETVRPFARVPADAFATMLASVRASGWGAPDALGLALDEEETARLARERAEEAARQRNAEEAARKYPYSGLLVYKASVRRARGDISGSFSDLPYGVPIEVSYSRSTGFSIPFPNAEIDGFPCWAYRIPAGLESAVVFPKGAGPYVASKTEILLTRAEHASLPVADHERIRKALQALKAEGLIDLRNLGEADLIGMDREDSEALINAAREYAEGVVPTWGRGALVDVQSGFGLSRLAVCSFLGSTFLPDIAAEIIHTAYTDYWTKHTPGTTSRGVMTAGSFEDWPLGDIFAKCVNAASGNRIHSPGAFLAGDVAPTFMERAHAKLIGPDPWKAVLLRTIDGKPHAKNVELLAALDAAGHPAVDNPITRKRLFSVMSALGWTKSEARIDGRRTKAWLPAETTP
jgi:hypothetical protein